MLSLFYLKRKIMKNSNGNINELFNTIVYILMCGLCLFPIFMLVDSIWIRIPLIFVVLLVCGYLEERVISRFVNELVEKFEKNGEDDEK